MKNTRKLITTKTFIPLLLISLALLISLSTVSANEIYVNTTGNDTSGSGTADNPYLTIQTGINNTEANGTIHIADGQYSGTNNTNITISKNLNIIGQSQENTIINGTNINQIFIITYGTTVTLENLTLTNGYSTTYGGAIYNQGDLTVTNCTFTNNTANYAGGAVYNYNSYTGSMNCTITGSNFNNNTAELGGAINNDNENTGSINCIITGSNFTNNTAHHIGGAISNNNYNEEDRGDGSANCSVTGSTFTNNTANYGGAINNYNYGVGSATCTVTGSTFTNNTAILDGGAIFNYNVEGSANCTITESTFTNNTANHFGGAITNVNAGEGSANCTANFNRFYNNTATTNGNAICNKHGSVDAKYNWWGSNDGPATGSIYGELAEYDPWLVMTYSANPTTIQQGSKSTLTADFRYDSNGSFHDPALGHLPDGTPVTFTTNLGNVGSKSVVKYTIDGIATAILRGDEAAGEALTTANLDNQTLNSTVTINAATVNAATTSKSTGNTVGMQPTGSPIVPLALAILSVLGGLITTRKKQ